MNNKVHQKCCISLVCLHTESWCTVHTRLKSCTKYLIDLTSKRDINISYGLTRDTIAIINAYKKEESVCYPVALTAAVAHISRRCAWIRIAVPTGAKTNCVPLDSPLSTASCFTANSTVSSAVTRISLKRICYNAMDEEVNAVCTTRTFACACWPAHNFGNQYEDIAPSLIIILFSLRHFI